MAALIPDEKGLVLDGYQFLKEFGLVPSIAEPVSHPHSLLSHHCLAVSLTLTSLNLMFNSTWVHCAYIVCVKLVFDSKVLQVQVSPSLHSLVAWLPTTHPTLHKLPLTIVWRDSRHDEAFVLASLELLIVDGAEVVADLVREGQRALLELGVLAVVEERHEAGVVRLPRNATEAKVNNIFVVLSCH